MTTGPDNQTEHDQNAIAPAEPVIERFGGIRPMAAKMNVPVTTVQGWKKRNVIPGNRRDDIAAAARQNNIDLSGLMAPGAARPTGSVPVHRATIAQEAPPAATPSRPLPIHDELIMGIVRRMERSAVTKSAVLTVVFVSALALGAAVVISRGHGGFGGRDDATQQELQDLRAELARVNEDMKTMKRQQGTLKDVIPHDIAQAVQDMKDKAENLQESVGQIRQQVEQVSEVARSAQGLATNVLGPNAGDLQQRLSALESQVQGLTGSTDLVALLQRVGQFQQTLEGQGILSSSTAQLSQIIGGLGGDMSMLDSVLLNTQGTDTPLGQTLEGVSPTDLKAASLLLGLTQFRSSLNRNQPFDEDLALLQSMLGEQDPELQEAITRLAPQASRGVLSPGGLSDEMKSLAGDIVVSSIKGEDVSIREKAMARLNEVFQVQKNGELVTGTDTQARVARAQKLLDEGNVEAAVTELESLDGPARETAQPLIEEAQMTALAQKVQDLLSTNIASQLKGIGGSSASYTAGGQGLDSIMQSIESLGEAAGIPGGVHLPSAPSSGRDYGTKLYVTP